MFSGAKTILAAIGICAARCRIVRYLSNKHPSGRTKPLLEWNEKWKIQECKSMARNCLVCLNTAEHLKGILHNWHTAWGCCTLAMPNFMGVIGTGVPWLNYIYFLLCSAATWTFQFLRQAWIRNGRKMADYSDIGDGSTGENCISFKTLLLKKKICSQGSTENLEQSCEEQSPPGADYKA